MWYVKWYGATQICIKWYTFDIGYKAVSSKRTWNKKIPKIRRLLLSKFIHFQSSSWHISIKKIRLFFSNVVALLQRTLLIDALGETFLLDNPPHHVKVSFIESGCFFHLFKAVLFQFCLKNYFCEIEIIEATIKYS